MSKYLGYEQTGFANSTVSITRAASGTTVGNNFANNMGTALYLPFDDLNDQTGTYSLTAHGDATLDTSIKKFGASSAKFDGTGDAYEVDDSIGDFKFEGDFTIECQVYPTNTTHGSVLGYHGSSGTSGWMIRVNSGSSTVGNFYTNSGALQLYTSVNHIQVNEWSHVAVTRQGSTVRFFVNGILEASGTLSDKLGGTGSTQDLFIGASTNASTQPYAGYIDDLRIIDGHAEYTEAFTPPTSAVGLRKVDPVSVYLPFDSDVNDDSSHGHTVTASGSATISSTQAKFGGNSLSLNGTNQYLTIPNKDVFNFGSGDFTIEMWIYMTSNAGSSASTRHGLVARRASDSNRSFHIGIQSESSQQKLQFSHSTTGSGGSQTNYDTDIQLNTWTHVAIVRSGPNVYAFVDGKKNTETHNIGTDTIYGGTSDLTIGYRAESSQYFPGYIDDLRISKGIARYTKEFLPPTAAVGATLTGANETNTTTDFTSLYLPLDSDQNDDSPYSSSTTVYLTGDASISSAQSKFGGNSLALDGTGDYLHVNPFGRPLNFDNFTVEAWVYPTTISGYQSIFDSRQGATTGPGMTIQIQPAGTIQVYATTDAGTHNFSTTQTVNANEWTHIAVVRRGRGSDETEIFINGTSAATGGITHQLNQTNFNIGFTPDGYYFNGYIDDYRILKFAKYVSDFVPPSSAHGTSISETVNDLAVLYLPFDGTNVTSSVASSQTSLYLPFDSDLNDDSSNGYTVTASGDAAISSTQAKYGGYSAYFDGTGDYLTVASGTEFQDFDSNPFTIEGWFYCTDDSSSSHNVIMSTGTGSSNWNISIKPDNKNFQLYDGTTRNITGVWTVNTWHHFAVCFDGSTLRQFIDGTQIRSESYSNLTSSATNIDIGRHAGASNYFTGYLDDLRIIKGTALYTASFTPPTSALGVSGTVTSLRGGFEDLARNHRVTKEGDTHLNPSVKKFGASSAKFDGTGDRLLVDHGGNLNLSDNDFTIEGWFYIASLANTRLIQSEEGSGTYAGWLLYMTSSGAIRFYASTNNASWDIVNAADLGTASLNTWTHLAVTREGNSFRCFQDGVLKSTTTSSSSLYYNTDNQISIGARDTTNYLTGYIDDLRIIKGHAMYTEAFTPPTSAHGHVSIETTSQSSESYSDNKFLSGVWNLRDAESKIQDGEWIRNDSDTGSVPSGLTIKGAGLEVEGHRHYTPPPVVSGVEILAVGAGGDGGNRHRSGGNTVFTHSVSGEYILAVGGGGAAPAGGGVGRAGGGGGGFVSATNLTLEKDVTYTLTIGGAGGITHSPHPGPSPSHPGGSGGGGTYVGGGVGRGGGTGIQPATPQPLISGIPGASNFQNLGYDGTSHPPNSDNPGHDNGPGRGGGGLGTSSSITGSPQTYAGGGYSGARSSGSPYMTNPGPGGNGGHSANPGGNGTRGGGGGGGGASAPDAIPASGSTGGAGVFVIAYPDSENALSITGSLPYSQPSRSGYRVYYFGSGGSSGTITVPS